MKCNKPLFFCVIFRLIKYYKIEIFNFNYVIEIITRTIFYINFFYFIITCNIYIVIRNGKIVWKHGSYCRYFHLNLKYFGCLYRAYMKIAKNDNFCEELFSENDFQPIFNQFLLLWPWCQVFWGSSEDRYRSKRVSQMLLVCYNLLNIQNIPINQ